MSAEQVIVLFTDIVGSTELSRRALPRRGRRAPPSALLGAAPRDRRDRGHRGEEPRRRPDGRLRVGVLRPRLRGRDAAGRRSTTGGHSAAASVSIRVGLSGGEITREEDDYFGDPVIEAARLCGDVRARARSWRRDVVRLMAGRRTAHECASGRRAHAEGAPRARRRRRGRMGAERARARRGRRSRCPPTPRALGRGFADARPSWRRLIDSLARVARGEARARSCSSPARPALGKTTLVVEAARAAHDDGAYVLFGHCEQGLATPYQLFSRALEHYVTHAPEAELREPRRRARLGDRARSPRRSPAASPTSRHRRATDPDSERFLLFAAVVGLLVDISTPLGDRRRARRPPVGGRRQPRSPAAPPRRRRTSRCELLVLAHLSRQRARTRRRRSSRRSARSSALEALSRLDLGGLADRRRGVAHGGRRASRSTSAGSRARRQPLPRDRRQPLLRARRSSATSSRSARSSRTDGLRRVGGDRERPIVLPQLRCGRDRGPPRAPGRRRQPGARRGRGHRSRVHARPRWRRRRRDVRATGRSTCSTTRRRPRSSESRPTVPVGSASRTRSSSTRSTSGSASRAARATHREVGASRSRRSSGSTATTRDGELARHWASTQQRGDLAQRAPLRVPRRRRRAARARPGRRARVLRAGARALRSARRADRRRARSTSPSGSAPPSARPVTRVPRDAARRRAARRARVGDTGRLVRRRRSPTTAGGTARAGSSTGTRSSLLELALERLPAGARTARSCSATLCCGARLQRHLEQPARRSRRRPSPSRAPTATTRWSCASSTSWSSRTLVPAAARALARVVGGGARARRARRRPAAALLRRALPRHGRDARRRRSRRSIAASRSPPSSSIGAQPAVAALGVHVPPRQARPDRRRHSRRPSALATEALRDRHRAAASPTPATFFGVQLRRRRVAERDDGRRSRRIIEQMIAENPGLPTMRASLAMAYAEADRTDECRAGCCRAFADDRLRAAHGHRRGSTG